MSGTFAEKNRSNYKFHTLPDTTGDSYGQRRESNSSLPGNRVLRLNTIQYNTILYFQRAAYTYVGRPTARYTQSVQFTVQFWSLAVNKNVFSLRLNSGGECKCLSSIDSLFQARGAAIIKLCPGTCDLYVAQ